MHKDYRSITLTGQINIHVGCRLTHKKFQEGLTMGSSGPPCLPTLIKVILCLGVSFIDVDLSSYNVLYLVLSPGWKAQNNYPFFIAVRQRCLWRVVARTQVIKTTNYPNSQLFNPVLDSSKIHYFELTVKFKGGGGEFSTPCFR